MTVEQYLEPLEAKLRKLGFEEYLRTETFELLLMEKHFGKVWNSHKEKLNDRFNKYREISVLVYILKNWLLEESKTNSEEARNFAQKSSNNKLISTIILGYIDWVKEEKNYSELLDTLKKLSIVTEDAIKQIEEAIQNKKYNTMKTMTKTESVINGIEQADYVVITALQIEMNPFLEFIEQEKDKEIVIGNQLISYGHFKGNSKKKIAYAVQHTSGMIDAAILATQMIIRCKPKHLIMIGVLAGKPIDTHLGDVVIAKKAFTIDKGKLTEEGHEPEIESANLESAEIRKIENEIDKISNYLKKDTSRDYSKFKIHFGAVACIRYVANKEKFFQDKVSSHDRKAIALEMESYGIARACEVASNGKIKPLIIKSVMDNAHNKTDDNQTFAALTSAKVLEYILEKDII